MVANASHEEQTITTPSPPVIHSFVRELALIPRRLTSVNRSGEGHGPGSEGHLSGTKLQAALLHQITQMIGFKT